MTPQPPGVLTYVTVFLSLEGSLIER